MGNNRLIWVVVCVAAMQLCSCSVPKKALLQYYTQNQKMLDGIEKDYRRLFAEKPFSIGFSDKDFNYVSVTTITDTLQYIYEFHQDEEDRLKDTLVKYRMDVAGVIKLIRQMRSVHCTWINKVDYYVNDKQMFLTFLSARAVGINAPFSYKKYYILAYFPESQYFDDEGRLYAGKRKRRLRKINNEVYSKINDKVCYTISENFR